MPHPRRRTLLLFAAFAVLAGCVNPFDRSEHVPATGQWSGQYPADGGWHLVSATLAEVERGRLVGTLTSAPLYDHPVVGTNRNLCVTLRSAETGQVLFRGTFGNPTWIEGDWDPDGVDAHMALASADRPAYDPPDPVRSRCG